MPAEAGAQDAMSLCNYVMSVCPNICLYKLCVISGAMYCLTDAEREETFLLHCLMNFPLLFPLSRRNYLCLVHEVSRKEMSTDPDILSVLLESES